MSTMTLAEDRLVDAVYKFSQSPLGTVAKALAAGLAEIDNNCGNKTTNNLPREARQLFESTRATCLPGAPEENYAFQMVSSMHKALLLKCKLHEEFKTECEKSQNDLLLTIDGFTQSVKRQIFQRTSNANVVHGPQDGVRNLPAARTDDERATEATFTDALLRAMQDHHNEINILMRETSRKIEEKLLLLHAAGGGAGQQTPNRWEVMKEFQE